ncbi:invasion associated locus B family protein [Agrobacterium rhizogenes]|uniref:invasion associated locus B family protein n=1 Tax=Rhizobium rhizogenes TaxID=359 RepID=UPI00157353E8|nr:invasion associated locus B family protein [Rhizobium rhizogenes]NTH14231.1 invasion associated locus B family protein [Rhizobium rhizogenes]
MLSKRACLLAVTATALSLALSSATPAFAEDTAALPGGASSLQETYDDWVVACAAGDQAKGQKLCTLSQQQFDKKSQQRVVAIEWKPSGDGIQGNLALPFGLALAKGAAFQFDDGPVGKPAAFSTCLPTGCLVPIEFNKDILAGMRKASHLNIKAVGADGKDIPFAISLKGFPNAFDRTKQLAN